VISLCQPLTPCCCLLCSCPVLLCIVTQASEVTVFRIDLLASNELAFTKVHTLPVAGGGSMAVFLGEPSGPTATANGEVYIVATSYHDPRTGAHCVCACVCACVRACVRALGMRTASRCVRLPLT
jgi:hypothetical protein